ncbi:DUF485 domain-containing protein [Streptomyces sp. NPDC021080]|uniref:DUF485 domain-containing protein n=1 Tax=Streptomyces sp. NPDC021080 TaxID=3365110 RepID=UPI003794B0C2
MPDPFPYPEYQPHRPGAPYHPAPHSSSDVIHTWQPHQEFDRGTTSPRTGLGHHSDLRLLRRAYRTQRRVATFTALGYFTLFLVLSAFAPSLMTGTVSGGLSTGLLLGLLQVPVTCLSVGLYEHTARRRVDPIADRMRKQAELAESTVKRGVAQ